MRSALELFCSRRNRLGRLVEDLELDNCRDLSLSERSSHRRGYSERRQSSRRQGLDGCVPVRRPSQWRMEGYGSAFMEGRPFNLNDGNNQYIPANSVEEEGFSAPSSRSRVTCSERLPSEVLQARERLLQRLRGAAVPERVSRRPTTNLSNDEHRLVNVKPLGHTPEVLNSLPVEIFSQTDCEASSDDKLVSWDCSICLESFSDGNQLVGLPCNHRFHLACLSQWGLIRGDCPCCRRNIV